ncbi:chaplin family protein [Actinocorallia sp. A-T 12471]|uniref:chaplin family protein n=1 Tax=Actinocorallia sp. A-T 12471 TaxID=3089813 RepID=UPI0029D0B206|nr:chaplin family protein [Actinocorallia sp. A-T 12471]MDX6741813.1 chaplin family protein [Actinocorallia sp. A-T 12471]
MSLKKIAGTGLLALTAFGVLGGAGQAFASNGGNDGPENNNNTGLLTGIQLIAPISIPVNLCGNGIAVLGIASGSCSDSGVAVKNDF